jgi:hypothetical protein
MFGLSHKYCYCVLTILQFVGLASRSDLLIRIFAVDEDPCTGDETERLVASATPDGPNRNKWKVDVPKNTDIGKLNLPNINLHFLSRTICYNPAILTIFNRAHYS